MPDGPAAPTAADFRRAAGFLANGITVVTTYVDGVDHAMTANSFTTVSLDPLLVLVCAERGTRFLDAVLGSGRWGVSVLDASAADAAAWFATKGRPLEGQLDRTGHARGPATGSALLTGALATFECVTSATHDAGDHVILVGHVVAVGVGEAATAAGSGPLVYYRGQYRQVGPTPSS